jgi:hypothetical protein
MLADAEMPADAGKTPAEQDVLDAPTFPVLGVGTCPQTGIGAQGCVWPVATDYAVAQPHQRFQPALAAGSIHLVVC